MTNNLRAYDKKLVTMATDDGTVLVSPGLQGRIFCAIGDELIHRLDTERLARPSPDEFNNLGGNSLWPAPEGGAFAFNYMAGDDEWVVQPGIADALYSIDRQDSESVVLVKTVELSNRAGTACRMKCSRTISAGVGGGMPTSGQLVGTGLQAVGYRCHDILEPMDAVTPDELLLAAWSLEQFPGGDGVTAFAKVSTPETAINYDFYGTPEQKPVCQKDGFLLDLGGTARFQIGVTVASEPLLLGALDRQRGLLILRRTGRQQGVYFNIADNDQPQGAFSAADMYSVFSGGDLGFFELETIGAMHVANGQVGSCELVSDTWIARGPVDALTQLLAAHCGIQIDPAGDGVKNSQ